MVVNPTTEDQAILTKLVLKWSKRCLSEGQQPQMRQIMDRVIGDLVHSPQDYYRFHKREPLSGLEPGSWSHDNSRLHLVVICCPQCAKLLNYKRKLITPRGLSHSKLSCHECSFKNVILLADY